MFRAMSPAERLERLPEVSAGADRAKASTWPTFNGKISGTALVDGRSVIMFGSNDYLGLAAEPVVIDAAKEAVDRHGVGTGMNPLLGVTSTHRELIEALQSFTGADAVLLFNSCTAANCAAIASLVGPEDVILSDQMNHASIIDGCRLSRGKTVIYPHADVASLRQKLTELAHRRLAVTVSDGVFSMKGTCAPLRDLLDATEKVGGVLILDESHSVGVVGESGRGTAELFRIDPGRFIQTGTLAKAFGAGIGGYVAGPQVLIDYLRSSARFFIFTMGLPAASAGAALAAIRLLRSQPQRLERLRDNVRTLRSGLEELGFKVLPSDGPILAIVLGSAERARLFSSMLMQRGIYIPAFGFPIVPDSEARLRIQVSAAHSTDDIATTIAAFKAIRDSSDAPIN